jgi:hypothetical protein
MTDEQFWAIIAHFDWAKTGDDDAVVQPAVRALAALGAVPVCEFQDLLAAKLYRLDTAAHAAEIGTWAYRGQDDDAFSADNFLYARCVVVANGPALFEHVLHHPAAFPKDLEFEALLSVAPIAYERATGQEFDHDPPVSFETYSNKDGWSEPAV